MKKLISALMVVSLLCLAFCSCEQGVPCEECGGDGEVNRDCYYIEMGNYILSGVSVGSPDEFLRNHRKTCYDCSDDPYIDCRDCNGTGRIAN